MTAATSIVATPSWWTWLSQEGPNAIKHQGWLHPVASLLIHYTIAAIVTFGVHDLLLETKNSETCDTDGFREVAGWGVAVYAIWLLLWRLVHCRKQDQSGIVYEYTWLCNVTLVFGAGALLSNRPIVATAHCVAVGIDQIMWYVDLIGWTASGFTKFPIGVMKYLTWPGTSFVSRITCSHHLWTIPLFVTAAGGVHVLSFSLSVIIVATNVLLSRWLTPFQLLHTKKYLNVNLSYELWRDIKLTFLQINYDNPCRSLYLFRLLWRWQLLNFLVFVALYVTSNQIFGPSPIC